MPDPTRDLLEKLHVADLMLGAELTLELPGDSAAYGRGAPTALTVAMLMAGYVAPFTPASLPEGAVPVRIAICRDHPAIVRLIDASDAPLSPVSLSGQGVGVSEQAPDTVFADFADAGGAIAVRRDDGTAVLVRLDGRRLVIQDLLPARLEVAPLAGMSAPLGEWAEACDDEWLASELRARADPDLVWQCVVGAGMCARLREPGSPSARREAVRAVLEGRYEDLGSRPRRWARQLSSEQVQTVEDLLLAAADRVATSLDDLEASMAPDEDWWRDALMRTCRDRDELECARLILAERGDDGRVASVLDALDAAGRRFMHTLPVVFQRPDEHLRRSLFADPEAWWASVARA